MINHLRTLRTYRGMTLEEVARKAGCTRAQVSKIETGAIRLNDQWLDIFSRVYQCSVHELIDDDAPFTGTPAYYRTQVQGCIDAAQAGAIDYWPAEQSYPLSFGHLPEKITGKLGKFPLLRGLILEKGNYHDGIRHFPIGSELVFAYLHPEQTLQIEEGMAVLCSYKDQKGRPTHDALRFIEYDAQGFPYAVYKRKAGRQAVQTITSTLLLGEISLGELMDINLQSDTAGYTLPPKTERRPLGLQHQHLDIRAVLVKIIQNA